MAAWPCHSRPTFAGRCPSGCHLATPPKRGPRGGPPERVPAPRCAAHVAAVPHGGVPVGRRRRGGLPPSRGGALGLRRLRRGTAGDHGGQEEPVQCPLQGASAAGPPRSGDQEAMDPGHQRGANPARPRFLCQRGADEPGRRRGVRKGLVSIESLRRFVDREKKSGRRGVGVLRRLVEQREPGYQPSASELQASVRRLLVAAGLEVEEEYVVTDAGGNFIARVDFRLFGEWVVVEVEGRAVLIRRLEGRLGPLSKLDWQHDLDRRNALTAEGWVVIHATADRVKNRPEEFLAEVHRTRARQARLRVSARTGSSARRRGHSSAPRAWPTARRPTAAPRRSRNAWGR